jgi:hypothetical protein
MIVYTVYTYDCNVSTVAAMGSSCRIVVVSYEQRVYTWNVTTTAECVVD